MKVILTGATGYIAKHVVKILLERGYTVVGTVRSKEKGDKLVKQFNSANFSYVIASLTDNDAFDSVLKENQDATAFFHTASPLPHDATDSEQDYLIPALEGTKSVLKAIKQYGPQIKHLVLTSSFAAVYDPFRELFGPAYTEKSWNPATWEQAKSDLSIGYATSKKVAEKAAWDFVENESPNFILTSINPSYVFGPQAFDEDAKGELNFSAEIINKVVKLHPDDQLENLTGVFIDVRDVARAHVDSITNERAYGQRLILSHQPWNSEDVIELVQQQFPQLKISKGNPGTSIRNNSEAGKVIDNSFTRKVLGFDFINLKQSVYDSVSQVIN